MSEDNNKKQDSAGATEVPYTGDLSLRGMLGQGGIGRVFLAFDKRIGREVAIKEPIAEKIVSNRERALARFVREARISGQLEHPGIIPVYELSKKEDGTYYYIMRRVEGKRLKEAIAECMAPTSEQEFRMRLALLPGFISVCEAMGYAHSKGVIHRDLKPENIILGEYGEAVLLDWGLAKKVDEEEPAEPPPQALAESIEDMADSLKTRQGAVLGTPSYMAPEQIDRRLGDVGPASDVYALGAILFFILTGDKMYSGTAKEIMDQIASDKPSPSPRARVENLPPELVAICEKAISKKQEARFKNASELASELKAFRDGRLVSVYAYSARELFARFVARNKVAIGAAVAVIISIIIGAGLALDFAADARAARARAERALVDVTALSGAAIDLASDAAEKAGHYYDDVLNGLEGLAKRLAASNSIHGRGVITHLKELKGTDTDALALATITPQGRVAEVYPEGSDIVAAFSELFSGGLAERFAKQRESPKDLVAMAEGSHVFAIAVPIKRGSTLIGALAVLYASEKAIPAAISFDPLKSDYQLWCMRDDGLIFYDEDPNQIGRFLFTDAMYEKFPELKALGEDIRKNPNGLGYYSFEGRGGGQIVYKIAAWDTFRLAQRKDLKVIVAYPYISR